MGRSVDRRSGDGDEEEVVMVMVEARGRAGKRKGRLVPVLTKRTIDCSE